MHKYNYLLMVVARALRNTNTDIGDQYAYMIECVIYGGNHA